MHPAPSQLVIASDVNEDGVQLCQVIDLPWNSMLRAEPVTISRALRLMFVARNLERIGDHAANIAEMVIFLVEGHDIRHSQTAKM